MGASFKRKILEIEITLGTGVFGSKGIKLKHLAAEVAVVKPGLPDKNRAHIKVWGLSYEDMVRFTTLSFNPLELENNYLRLRAGEDGGSLSSVFEGEIVSAYADFNASPEIVMRIEAQSGLYPQLMAHTPLSVKGEASAANLIAAEAAKMGYVFKNEGISSAVRDAVFSGSPMKKIQDIARQIGAEIIVDDAYVVLIPAGGARSGKAVLMTPENGMLGYPAFNQDGIVCRSLFKPELKYAGLIDVRSIVPRASGIWRINKLSHHLCAFKNEGGKWESKMEAVYVR